MSQDKRKQLVTGTNKRPNTPTVIKGAPDLRKGLIVDTADMQRRRCETQLKVVREEVESLHHELEQRRLQLESLLALDATRPVSISARKRSPDNTQREACAVLLCSDWHVEEKVDPVTINSLNEYDPIIAESRIEKLGEAFCWLIRDRRFDIRKAVIWLGGDLMTGYIHEELVEGNAMSPTQTLLWLHERISKMIRKILRDTDLEEIVIPCSYGNHGRTTLKSRISTGAANSFEWLLYNFLAREFSTETRIKFQIATGEHLYLPVYDYTLRFQHGDAIRFGGGVGGLTIPLRKAISQWQTVRKADVDHFGHWHQYLSLPGAVVNGSLIGFNAYALHIKAAFEPPTQAFYLLDTKRGPCQHTGVWF